MQYKLGRRPFRRSALALAAATLLGPLAVSPVAAATCQWDTTAGNWAALSNWLTCAAGGGNPTGSPGSSDIAIIGSSGIVTVNTAQAAGSISNAGAVNIDAFTLTISGGANGGASTNSGTITAGSLSTGSLLIENTVLTNNGANIIVNGAGSFLNQINSTIVGGTLTTTNGGLIQASNSSGNFLSGVTLNGTLDLASGTGIERVTNGLTLNGAIKVDNNSILAFQGDQTIGGTGTITLGSTGSSNRITTEAGNLTLGSGITINGQNGTIGGQNFAGGPATLTNNGTISASVAGGQINLAVFGGGLTTNNGVLSAQNGGNLLLTSAVTNGGGGQVNATGTGSVVTQNGITISGGTINTSGGGTFVASNNGNNQLAGVTLKGTLDLATSTGLELVTGNLTFGTGGVVNINSNSTLGLEAATLSGTGTITFGSTGASNRMTIEAGNSVIGTGVTVNGQNGTIGGQIFDGGAATLTNNGTISADVSGGTIALNLNGLTTNNGVLSAQNGGNLLLSTTVTNGSGGQINAVGPGSVVTQSGITISGGTINTSGGGTFVASNSGGNQLAGVIFKGTLDLATHTGLELVTGNLVFGAGGGIVNINSNSTLGLEADTVSGNGTITFGSTGASNRLAIEAGNSVIGSGVLIHGENGTIGGQVFAGGAATLTNNGTISADVGGGTITLNVNGTVTNNGTLSALNGGTLVLDNSIIGTPGSSIIVGAGSTLLQNGVALNGIINSSGTGNFLVSNSSANTLNAVTFSGNLNLASGTSQELALNGLTLTPGSSISINNNSVFALEGDTLGGTGTVTFGGTGSSNRLNIEAGNSVIGAGILVHGQNGTIGDQNYAGGTATLTNNGTISADVAGGIISIGISSGAANALTNNGVLSAANGGTLVLNSNVTGNAGSYISVGAGSTVIQNGVTLTGIVNNSGTGKFSVSNSSSNILNGVTFTGPLDLSTSTSQERALNGLSFGAGSTVSINNNSTLAFQNEEIGGTAVITLGNTGSGNRVTIEAGATVLDAGITIQGQNGTVGTQNYAGGAATLANAGVITANVALGTITLNVAGLTTNTGTLSAQNGGRLVLDSAVTNAGSGHIGALGANSVVYQNGITITGGTLNTSGGGTIGVSNSGANILSGVTLAGTLDLASASAQEQIGGGSLALSGAAINVNSNSLLALEASTVSGSGTITFGSTGSNNRLTVEAGDSVIGAGVTIHGQNGTIGTQAYHGGAATLTNNGVITADTGGGNITLSVSGLTTNNATLSAQNGSSLTLNSAVTNGASGHIDAIGTGSVVVQNGITISGGTLNTGGGGAIVVTNSGSNFLANTTLAGTLDLASSTGQERLLNTTVTLGAGGVININNNSLVDLQASNVNGTGTINLGATGSSNRIAIEAGNSTIGSGVTIQGQNGTLGDQYYVGGPATLTNNGTISANVAGGTIRLVNASFVNNGTFSATAGVLSANTGFTGTGTALTSGNGQLIIGAASTVGNLVNNGTTASALTLGTNNITVSGDYNNASFGVGNSFNARANVTGTGQILAGGGATQVISGSNITNGNTSNATLTIGNVHVGANTFNYQINDGSASGPTLRGAIQTNVNGANLTDSRLSGSGVTASNYSSSAGPLAVTYTATSAGAQTLSGQVLNLTSNFANIADQKLNIVFGSGAAAYNLATGSTGAVVIANQRVGGGNSGALTVSNNAPISSFTEALNASFAGSTGNVTGTSGAITGGTGFGVAGGASNGTAMTVALDTATAGAKSGTVTLNYVSNGTGSSGLGNTAVGSQTVNVTGNVYNAAVGAVTPSPISFGNVHVGALATQALTVHNNAASGSFSEALDAGFSGATGSASGTGTVSNIAAGASNGSALSVALNTATAGAKTGSVTVAYKTDGTGSNGNSGLAAISAGSQTVNVTGGVYNLASSSVIAPISLVAHVGDGGGTVAQALTITNTAPAGSFSEGLNSSFGGFAAGAGNTMTPTLTGSITNLGAGLTDSSSMRVAISTATAGVFNGTVTVDQASNGAGTSGLGITNLASQQVAASGSVTAGVFNYAAPTVNNTQPIDFGNVRIGTAAASQAISVSNTAPVSAFTEALNGSVVSASTGFSATGAFTGLQATSPATANTSISVGMNTGTGGHQAGNVVLGFVSDGTGIAGDGTTTTLTNQSVAVTGNVYRLASPTLNTSAVTIAARVGDNVANVPAAAISVTNTSADAYTEGLKASISGVSGNFNASGAIGNLAAGLTDASTLKLGLASTATSGTSNGTATLAYLSTGAGTDNAAGDLSVGTGSVNLTSKVYQTAVAAVSSAVDFGVVHVGDTISRAINVTNQATGALVDVVTGAIANVTGAFTKGSATLGTGVASGSSVNSNALTVGINTGTAGVYNGSANLALSSHDGDLADVALAIGPVALKGTVNNYAVSAFEKQGGAGVLSGGGNQYTLNLGRVAEGSSELTAVLAALNGADANAPADLLDGYFQVVSGSGFVVSGDNPFTDLGAGESSAALDVSLLTSSTGDFTETLELLGTGHNASGYSGAVAAIYLTLTGEVGNGNGNVPEPGTLALMLAAAGAGWMTRRRTTQRGTGA